MCESASRTQRIEALGKWREEAIEVIDRASQIFAVAAQSIRDHAELMAAYVDDV